MSRSTTILVLSLVVIMSGCNAVDSALQPPAPTTASTHEEKVDVTNYHDEQHRVTIVVFHDGEPITNQTTVLPPSTEDTFIVESVTYQGTKGEQYTLKARMDNGKWYSTTFTERYVNEKDVGVRVAQNGKFGLTDFGH